MRTFKTVVHLALNPVTGPKNLILQFLKYDKQNDLRHTFLIVCDREWYKKHSNDFTSCTKGSFVFIPKLPGTLQFLLADLLLSRNLANKLKEIFTLSNTPLVIHCHNAWLSGAFVRALDKCRFDCHFVVTIHGFAARYTLRRQLLRRQIHKMWLTNLLKFNGMKTTILSVDSSSVEEMVSFFNIQPFLYTVVPNGFISPYPIPSISSNRKRSIGFLGNLTMEKGIKLVVQACIDLSNSYDFDLIIAGEGPLNDYVLENCERYKFMKYLGYIKNTYNGFFDSINFLALPTTNDGLPMCLIESLYFGIPVVSCKVGGVERICVDQITGFIVSPDLASVKFAFESFICMDELQYQEFRVRSRDHFDRCFALDECLKLHGEIYG